MEGQGVFFKRHGEVMRFGDLNDDNAELAPASLAADFKLLSFTVGAFLLLAATVSVFYFSTVQNGLALIGCLLALLTLRAFIEVLNLRQRRKAGKSVPPLVEKLLTRFFASIAARASGASGNIAAQARQMAQDGVPLEDICRKLNPDYGTWSDTEKTLFRTFVEAMIRERK
jgi:hypothetical protein